MCFVWHIGCLGWEKWGLYVSEKETGQKSGSPTWRSVREEKWELGRWGGSGHGMLGDLGARRRWVKAALGGARESL